MQQLPQNPMPSQPKVLTNHFPQQGFVVSQPQRGQAARLPQPSGPGDYQILMTNSDEVDTSDVNLQTQSCQYDKPSTSSSTESETKASTEPLKIPNGLLQIPQPNVESIPKIQRDHYVVTWLLTKFPIHTV